jgi:hypothetical protein
VRSSQSIAVGRIGFRMLGDRQIVDYVNRMVALLKLRQVVQREIDGMVYALYGLTDAEIRIVEEATA